tara:strand:- start:608 stop:1006 length:399 start_codon:yes stop_codon:yes gene_type:complete
MSQKTPSISADDTKDYILYIYRGEANSMEALKLLNSNISFSNRCAVKNIADMPDIPAFLQGVPTLFIKKTKLIVCGTKCLRSMQEEQKNELQPMGVQQQNFVSAPGAKENVNKYNAGKVDDEALKMYMARRQ